MDALTGQQVNRVCAFLDEQRIVFQRTWLGEERERRWWDSYHSWRHGGRGWHKMQCGGTQISMAIAWYQHLHRPGSKEWRPSIIIKALLAEATRET